MTFYDQHMHTLFSPDSQETFENYLEQTNGLIISTEHLDFDDPYNDGADTILDYEEYIGKINQLNNKYGDRVRRGIEIGYTEDSFEKIERYLEGKEFDVQLLSVHQNGTYDFLMPVIDRMDPKDVMKEYFDLCITAVTNVDHANVFAHFDYGLRRLPVDVEDLKEFEPTLRQLLNLIIGKNMALELNTRSMYEYENVELYRYIIGLYLEEGGEKFSIGSDAHSIEQYRYHFDDAVQLLKEFEVTRVVQFKDQEPYFEDI